MKNLIHKIDLKVDIDKLKEDCNYVLSQYDFNKHNQICFQNTTEDYDVYEGTGDARLSHCPMYGLKETDFKYFNPEFNNTIFKHIYDVFPFKIGRMRLAKLPAKKCYWMHTDPGMTRFHFAIHSNKDCLMVYRDYGAIHIPDDGFCYKMKTEEYHTAINASKEDRIHLLITGL